MDELPIRREFGRRVRRRRLALDLFQKDLARQIDMPPTQLSRLEKGGYRSINIAKLVQLADALHTSTDYLLARSEDPGPVPNRIAPVAVAAHNHLEVGPQTRELVGPHWQQTRGTSDPQ